MNADNLPSSLQEAAVYFNDEKNCHDTMVQMRWPDGEITCPHCASRKIGKLVVSVREISGRTLKSGKVVEPYTLIRRVWNCKGCKKQFTAKVGTLFEDSPIALGKWLLCLWMLVNCKNGISSYKVSRDLKVTQKSAWFMLQRLRLALHEGGFEQMSGGIEADETFIGGKARLMNAKTKAKRTRGTGPVAMTPVQGLLERGTRDKVSRVKLHVLKGTKKADVQRAVREYVLKGSEAHTDALKSIRASKTNLFTRW